MLLSVLQLFSSVRLLFLLHFSDSEEYPKPLSRQDEEKCFTQLASGIAEKKKKARENLILHNMRLVAHIIKKYDTANESKEDLLSIGTLGLIKAVDSFTPARNVRFSTYAARCIENELLMKFRSNRKTERDTYLQDLLEEDSEKSYLDFSERISDSADIQEKAVTQLMIDCLKSKLDACLTPREQLVLQKHFGLNGEEELPQWAIAKTLGVSRSYVSRIEKKAIKKLRYAMNVVGKKEED